MHRSIRLALAFALLPACFDPKSPGEAEEGSTGETSGVGPGEESMSPSTSGASSEPTSEPTSSDPTTDGETEDPTTGPDPASCGDGAGVCVAVPSGWSGPVAASLAGAGDTPDCGDAEANIVAQGDIDGTEASCECQCMPATGATCEEARLIAWGTDNTCSATEVFSQVLHPDDEPGDPCNFMPSGGAVGEVPIEGASFWTFTTESVGGSCDADASANIPTAAYQSSVAGCSVAEIEGTCEGDATCYGSPEAPLEPGVCLWRLGEHECPDPVFSTRTLWYRGDLDDTRTCSGCSCGDAVGSCPTSTVDLFEGFYCNDAASVIENACVEHCFGDEECITYAISSLFHPGPAEAECEPTGGELTGELVASDPVTFCCTD